jgi:hypothetical protein
MVLVKVEEVRRYIKNLVVEELNHRRVESVG